MQQFAEMLRMLTGSPQGAPQMGVPQIPQTPTTAIPPMYGEATPGEQTNLARAGMKNDYSDLYASRLKAAQGDANAPMPQGKMVGDRYIPDLGGAMNTGWKNYQGTMKAKELEKSQDANLKQYQGASNSYMDILTRLLRGGIPGGAGAGGGQGENITIPTEY